MYPLTLIETLRMDDGRLLRLPCHEARHAEALRHFWPQASLPALADRLRGHGLGTQNDPRRYPGTWKVRVCYGLWGDTVEAAPYRPKAVGRLRMVADDTLDYRYKYADRSALARCLALRGDCDDVAIVRHGLLTDTSYTNLALFDGRRWVTPRSPLLRGTMRASLLDEGRLEEADIRPEDLDRYPRACLLNAMLPPFQALVTIDRRPPANCGGGES